MDLGIFTIFLFFSLFVIVISFWKKVPYMAALGGFTMVLLGAFMDLDGGFTTSKCVYNANATAVECINHTLPTFSLYSDFQLMLGAMLMLIGIGVILDVIVRTGENY